MLAGFGRFWWSWSRGRAGVLPLSGLVSLGSHDALLETSEWPPVRTVVGTDTLKTRSSYIVYFDRFYKE